MPVVQSARYVGPTFASVCVPSGAALQNTKLQKIASSPAAIPMQTCVDLEEERARMGVLPHTADAVVTAQGVRVIFVAANRHTATT